MIKNKKNGFTLVELLAVIVILAIILVIAVPKVMDVIKDSKKATLESTAKMIASTAEKVKVQNELLGKTEELECDKVAKINDIDYANCDIDFDGNTAKVTIEGAGKFEGLYVCGGTKTNSTATDESCPIPYGDGDTYITKLLAQESTQHNGLVQTYATVNGEQVNAGIRYAGPSEGEGAVKNQVYFNCKDKYTSDSKEIKYGDEDYVYEGNCEVWRIIGVFDTKSSDNPSEKPVPRIKIVRDAFSTGMSWDSSSDGTNEGETNVNGGNGINQWGEIKDSSGNIIYEGADLMRVLNGYYIGESSECTYCDDFNQGTCPTSNNCASIVGQISSTSLKMVDDALWYTGETTYNATLPLSTMYEGERGTQTGKICPSTDSSCNDNVTRMTTWVGKVGLIYPSDYAYASISESCTTNIVGRDSTCNTNNWLHSSSGLYWTITPRADSYVASGVWGVYSSDRVYKSYAYCAYGVRPALYLHQDVQIIGGDGTVDYPYILKAGEE